MQSFISDKTTENIKGVPTAPDKESKNRFLTEEREHILYLTARILRKTVTDSDDEFSIALMAVSEAIDSYKEEKGAFWSYASLVIKSRILDHYRKASHNSPELLLDPLSFEGDYRDDDTDADISIKNELNRKTAVFIDNPLKDELDALEQELKGYDIDLFDLPAVSPKSAKTKKDCAGLVKAFFLPPPLLGLLKKTGKLPVAELLKRYKASRKLVDRHRKFILASILIKAGEYSKIESYMTEVQ